MGDAFEAREAIYRTMHEALHGLSNSMPVMRIILFQWQANQDATVPTVPEATERLRHIWQKSKRALDEAVTVTKTFSRLMSPLTHFDELPLANCDHETRRWLGELIHHHWLVVCNVEDWCRAVVQIAGEIELEYQRASSETLERPSLQERIKAFVDLHLAIMTLLETPPWDRPYVVFDPNAGDAPLTAAFVPS